MKTDIAVIGGGASGLAAAITAKETCPQADVTVIERLPRTGKKILAAGNGKCNISNISLSSRNYHGSVDAMAVIGSEPDYRAFFTDKLGVLCVTGSEGRSGGVYPRSNSSTTILSALRSYAGELGVTELCDCQVTGIRSSGRGFVLECGDDTVECRKVIVAAGGYAGPSFGTDGSMMRILKNMGYRTAKVCPAVAPLRTEPDRLKGLKGVRVKGTVSAVSGGKVLRTEKGEIQFNDNNISGICVFNLAYLFQQYEGKLTLAADLAPDMSEKELTDHLFSIKKSRRERSAEELLTGMFVRNLAVYIVKNAGIPLDTAVGSIASRDICAVAALVKNLSFPVTGCAGWQNAQVTCGGIHGDCVNSRLESKLHRGLFLCGEILDVAGDCGGYNLQWAWSSGMLAGRSCAESLKGGER